MLLGAVFFAGREWLAPVGAALLVAAGFIAWSYARSSASVPLKLTCAALKSLGVAALLACLLEPMWSRERAKPGANVFAVIADNSRSLTLQDEGAQKTRAVELRESVAGERSEWRKSLAENFEVRNYLADSRLRPTESFGELNFEGRTSGLGEALNPRRRRSGAIRPGVGA